MDLLVLSLDFYGKPTLPDKNRRGKPFIYGRLPIFLSPESVRRLSPGGINDTLSAIVANHREDEVMQEKI
ncbi:MAG: hypothetical protein RBT64_08380, partial [Trichloromonas sp.]|nr:hypothetical protein [Trichloromonas sp.]